jgi:gliding motility-associated-like protein
MRKATQTIYIVVWLILMSLSAYAQNLVPNPSFESYNACPTGLSGIAYSPGYTAFPTVGAWVNPLFPTTPDYFNVCASIASSVNVPEALFGYRMPHTGSAFAGIVLWNGHFAGAALDFDYREYLQCKLTQPMQSGHQYCVSYYIVPTIATAFNYNYVAIKNVDVNFAGTQTTGVTGTTLSLPNSVTYSSAPYINDTANWTLVTGTYTATGGEQWLTMGSFKTTAPFPPYITITPTTINPTKNEWEYLYIDDVSVMEIVPADTIRTNHDTLICQNFPVSIHLQGAVGNATYYWNTGATTPQITATDSGIYWCVARTNCNTFIDSFHVRVIAPHSLSLGKDTFNCHNLPITIGTSVVYNTYLWNTGATTPNITIANTGSYILTTTDDCGTYTDTIQVAIQSPTPAPIVSDTTLCQYVYNPSLNIVGTHIRWYSDLGDNYGYLEIPTINTITPGDYTYYVTQTIGKCESPKVSIHVKIMFTPVSKGYGDTAILCKGDTMKIGHLYPDVYYQWNNGNTACCIVPDVNGAYIVIMEDNCGIAVDTTHVDIEPCDDCIAIPNAFTPNHDGHNDKFDVIVKCPVDNYTMKVFNRWGEMVFSTDNTNDCWDGMWKGAHAAVGVYVYAIEYRSITTGAFKRLKGNVMLIR